MLGRIIQAGLVLFFVYTSLAIPTYFPRTSQLISANMDWNGLMERDVMGDISSSSANNAASATVSISAAANATATGVKGTKNKDAEKEKGKEG